MAHKRTTGASLPSEGVGEHLVAEMLRKGAALNESLQAVDARPLRGTLIALPGTSSGDRLLCVGGRLDREVR